MTLVLAMISRETIWMLTDRRLSYGLRRAPIEDGVKIADLTASDGHALIGYAGLGATSNNLQPSEWIVKVLRGRGLLTLEQSLSVLSDAAAKEMPRWLRLISPTGTSHHFIAPAFLNHKTRRLYSIDNMSAADQDYRRYTYHVRGDTAESPARTFAVAGTGGLIVGRHAREWGRPLLSLAKACDGGRVSEYAVADRLAALNMALGA